MDLADLVRRVETLQLATPRLSVRRFRADDLPIALEHELDRRIMRYVRDPQPRAEVIGKVDGLLGPWKGADGEWLGLPMTLSGQDEMIGLVAFRVVSLENETVEIGYRLHPDHHRKGFTLEASHALLDFLFDVAGVRKAVAYCAADNAASYRLLEKLGMQREGCLRQYSRLGGKWCDELVYGLLASERGATRCR